jgi:hypothetical protein
LKINILILLLFLPLFGCNSSGDDGSFDQDLLAFQVNNNRSDEWTAWLAARKSTYLAAYRRARSNPNIRVEVRYDRQIEYSPPWADENEHFAALKNAAELTFPGWSFTFSASDSNADVIAILGYTGGSSFTEGNTVYLVFESIFTHEFAHTLGIPHHYCSDNFLESCSETPPDEGECIMSRSSVSWGPVEQFVLNLSGERFDDEITAILEDIIERYPEDYP